MLVTVGNYEESPTLANRVYLHEVLIFGVVIHSKMCNLFLNIKLIQAFGIGNSFIYAPSIEHEICSSP